jgi:hypothetical protein
VINGSPTQEPSPAVQSLPSGLGEPAAVIHASPWRGSSAATTATALSSSRPALGSISPGESMMYSSKVTPSSPMHSPVCRANATTTSILDRSSSNAVAPSVCIHQQNVNRSGSHTQTSQTLRSTSPALLNTSRCSQTPLELSKVLSDSARAFSGAPECTYSYGGAFSMLRYLTYRIAKFWSS